MVILDVRMDNLYALKNFHMNLTYPKKIVGSSIEEEHLEDRPNFRYKKVNVIMGANASGKTTFGRALMKIFNFIDKKNYSFITDIVGDRKSEASFVLDMASKHNIFYRISCRISPCENEKYSADNISIEIRQSLLRLFFRNFAVF
jgi:AAA15 family ATPase/GTPase